ncbi:hypothetical protein [Maricaulis sp.]|uniref:hypothetical protein n=1 Tax=Maricaulis sp. TaxID=1486257 RepID=UPI0026333487|nr:hypothetical protein [Maricaulis sp.]
MKPQLIALATTLALAAPPLTSTALADNLSSHAVSLDTASLDTGITLEAAAPWLAAHCTERSDLIQDPTDFPLAQSTMHHVQCTNDGHTRMLTFADDTLIMIETRGEIDGLVPQTAPAMQMAQFDVYPETTTIHDRDAGRLVRLNSLHEANLLLFWDNPAWSGSLPNSQGAPVWNLPDDLAFGSGIAEIETALDGRCLMMRTRTIDEVWLMTEPAEQVQIDCFGYDMAGYPRTLELIFGDGRLEQMWILIGTADIERARAHFTAIHGEPTQETNRYIVFDDWAFSIRKDVPEFLIGSAQLQAIWQSRGN